MVRVTNRLGDGMVQSVLRAKGRIISEKYIDNQVVIGAALGSNQIHRLKKIKNFEPRNYST